MTMFWEIFWSIGLIVIICGLARQIEIETMNNKRREVRTWLRHKTWAEFRMLD